MRKKIVYCLLIFYNLFRCISVINAQPSEFKWAKCAGGTGGDIGSGITVDELGNSFITGSFEDTAIFGSTTLISAGHTDIFFAKYDTAGNIVWIKQIGDIGPDRGNSICMDKFGNCLVTGTFSGTVNFGTIKLTSVGGEDIFIAKYDAMGNVVWGKQAGGGGDDIGYGIATDRLGNIFITGLFNGDATFDKIILRSSSSRHDMFIAKYDKLGNVLWANKAGGDGNDYGDGIVSDSMGCCLITGSFEETALFGTTVLNSVGGLDIFIAKYDQAGNVVWVKQAGGIEDDIGTGIACGRFRSCYVTGYFREMATFDTTTITSGGSNDIFIAKYDKSGNFLWVKSGGKTTGDNRAHNICSDYSANSFITGEFSGVATFGTDTLVSYGQDIFIVKYDELGNVLWAKRPEGQTIGCGYDVTIDKNNNIFITGMFMGTANFDSTILISAGGRDIFIAKLCEENIDITAPTEPKNLTAEAGIT